MFRPEIKVIDCSVRDGGLMNKWQFDDSFVCKTYTALTEAGIDYMEIGYLSSESAFSRDEMGPWKFCSEEDIQRIIEKVTKDNIDAICAALIEQYGATIDLPIENSGSSVFFA